MSESPRTLDHYRLVEKVGEGGMGVVWRAEDTKLGRDVAIKVLPELFSADPERLVRFEREAKLLASLNHPNIAAIYGFEKAEGVHFLVLELVDGEDLAEVLARGPLPQADALPIAAQIAEALQTAHSSGVLHRDLKPANVKLDAAGRAKVLDFGLAKAFLPDTSSAALSLSPTMTAAATQSGVLLGTAAYMSPEQARGKAVDKRTDIWAFGCVLFELLTGRQAFRGGTVTDILAAILQNEPDWGSLPPETPQAVRRVLERCLQKDAGRRFHDIADVRIFLEDAIGGQAGGITGGITGGLDASGITIGAAAAEEEGQRRRFPAAVHAGWMAAALVIAVLAYIGGSRGVSPADDGSHPPAAFVVTLPTGVERVGPTSPPALSPDGTKLAFVVEEGGEQSIYLRYLDRLEPERLSGTENGRFPFFSPDGSQLAFFSQGMLQVLSLDGGAPQAIAPAANSRGGAWGEDGWIYFTPEVSTGLQRIREAGGQVEDVTETDPAAGERSHRLPDLLPGGGGLLITVGTSRITSFAEARVDLVSLPGGDRRTLIEDASHARYADTGHIVYSRGGTLLAVPFDLDRKELTGAPKVVLNGIAHDPLAGVAGYSVSRSGSLAYLAGEPALNLRSLAFLDREGNATPVTERQLPYLDARPSPDGRYLVMHIDGANANVWVHDIERDTLSRLTMEWSNFAPIWHPDGATVTFYSDRTGQGGSMFSKPADGSGEPVALGSTNPFESPTSWSPDGRFLLFDAIGDRDASIWVLDTVDDSARPFIETPFSESGGKFSPDGSWVAYQSDETGEQEVYVQPFPGPGRKWPISSGGATLGGWSPDGSELFYANEESQLLAMPVETGSEFRPGRPRVLFTRTDLRGGAIMPDGERFVVLLDPDDELPPGELRVILGWARNLPRLAPPSP